MKKILTLAFGLAFLTACNGQDQQIAANEKEIALLKQQAEIQKLKNDLAQMNPASAAAEVYQLAASEVANTIPTDAQELAKKTGEVVQGNDGQQYMYDPDSGNWLLYGALGAAMGYMAANALGNRGAASKYQPVNKPTAAVQRVYQNQRTIQAPTPRANPSSAQSKPANTYRPTNQGYSNTRAPMRRSFGGRRR